jgi:HAMP domain-containing protein
VRVVATATGESHRPHRRSCEDERVSAVDLLAVVGAIGLVVACVTLYAAAARLLAAARRMEAATEDFNSRAAPLVEELARSAVRAADEVGRVEHLLDISEGIGSRVEGATGTAYRAITTPAIKGVALAEGTRRAARRLGGRN